MTTDTNKRPFAVFDIDGTLIRWQLFHAIVHKLGKAGHITPKVHQQILDARMSWKNRETNEDFKAYEHLLVHAYLNALPSINPADYNQVVDEVIEEYKDQTFTYTRNLIRKLKSEGYLLFAVSGSQQEAIDKLAAYHGFDAAIGAKLEVKDGLFTSKVDTPIRDKKAALEQLVAAHNATYENSYGVGDSKGDVVMLELVEHPVVINPDKELFAIASQKQWPVIVERKNVVYNLKPGPNGYTIELPTKGEDS